MPLARFPVKRSLVVVTVVETKPKNLPSIVGPTLTNTPGPPTVALLPLWLIENVPPFRSMDFPFVALSAVSTFGAASPSSMVLVPRAVVPLTPVVPANWRVPERITTAPFTRAPDPAASLGPSREVPKRLAALVRLRIPSPTSLKPEGPERIPDIVAVCPAAGAKIAVPCKSTFPDQVVFPAKLTRE